MRSKLLGQTKVALHRASIERLAKESFPFFPSKRNAIGWKLALVESGSWICVRVLLKARGPNFHEREREKNVAKSVRARKKRKNTTRKDYLDSFHVVTSQPFSGT